MSKNYGWTGQLRHGLWKCARCNHWNYYRTHSIRIDSRCYAQGCEYRARVVLDREDRKGGRPRQVVVKEYPAYRPPSTVKQEQRARNIWQRRNHEQATRMGLKLDLGVFHKASTIQQAIDEADLDRHLNGEPENGSVVLVWPLKICCLAVISIHAESPTGIWRLSK